MVRASELCPLVIYSMEEIVPSLTICLHESIDISVDYSIESLVLNLVSLPSWALHLLIKVWTPDILIVIPVERLRGEERALSVLVP